MACVSPELIGSLALTGLGRRGWPMFLRVYADAGDRLRMTAYWNCFGLTFSGRDAVGVDGSNRLRRRRRDASVDPLLCRL